MIEGGEGLFARTEDFPNPSAQARLAALVGMGDLVDRLVTDAEVLPDPRPLQSWSESLHGEIIPAVMAIADRTPLFVFAGDVGVGKTEVAELIGQAIATRTGTEVTLYPLSLTARGRGAVGEMTTLLTRAFERITVDFARARRGDGSTSGFGVRSRGPTGIWANRASTLLLCWWGTDLIRSSARIPLSAFWALQSGRHFP